MWSERKPADALAVSMMIVLCMCWGLQWFAPGERLNAGQWAGEIVNNNPQ